jgi:hypothetical protein
MTKIGLFALTLSATVIAATTVHAQQGGSQPLLSFSWRMWQQLKDNPAACVNVKTAKTLGITIPQALLGRTEVIE